MRRRRGAKKVTNDQALASWCRKPLEGGHSSPVLSARIKMSFNAKDNEEEALTHPLGPHRTSTEMLCLISEFIVICAPNSGALVLQIPPEFIQVAESRMVEYGVRVVIKLLKKRTFHICQSHLLSRRDPPPSVSVVLCLPDVPRRAPCHYCRPM